MKKFKKLLSVFLAVVMMLSSFAVLANARAEYANPGAYYYDSNDNPRAYLYSDEQRASILMDLIDNFLGQNLGGVNVNVSFLGIYVNLSSFDELCKTMDKMSSFLKGMAGDIGDLSGESILAGGSRASWGDQTSFKKLVEFLGANGALIQNVLTDGLQLGDLVQYIAGDSLDLTSINELILGLPDMLGGLVYGFGNRQITNGIGNDPKYSNTTAWDDLTGTKPTIDASLQNILYKLLTEPNNTEPTNNPDRNEIITNPEKFGATSAMIHQDENGYYYIYGTKDEITGEWTFTENSTVTNKDGTEGDRHDICQWKDGSALVKGVAATELKEILNLSSGLTLYQMLEKAIPWAYDTFAGHNLDGQLRATLMQFCGAFNNGNVDEETKATLKAEMDAYKDIEKNADGDKAALRDAFAAKQGAAGNVNFMYIDLDGKKIGDKTAENLYYVVEWGGSYQYYHVELGDVSPFYDLIDWEYQAPMWETIIAETSWTEGTSILKHINDIVGTILTTAVPTLEWTAGTAEDTLKGNVEKLVRLVITTDTVKLFGSEFELPAGFNNYDLEDLIVMVAGVILDDLMPQLVLPATVTSIEEVAVYAVREFTAEILPHLGEGWDEMIAEAAAMTDSAKEDAYLDILLNMGTSIGAYYLQNLIGLGTVTTDTSNDNNQETVPMGADYTWKEILGYIVDWVIETWLGDLQGNIAEDFSAAMADGNNEPLLKLSAILSKLFEHLVRILGADVDGYALNLEHVYTDLREVLNGDFSALAVGLQRDTTADSSANMTLYEAIAQLLIDLFGGLGMEDQSSWNSLKGLFTTALGTTAPLNKLVGTNSDLAKFARYFVECLCGARERWVDDALIFIAMLLGYESPLSMSDINVEGVEAGYTGSEENTVSFTFGFTTKGVKTYFNNGRYRTNKGALEGQTTGFDGDYSLRFIDAEVVNAAGDQKGYKKWGDNGYVMTANTSASDSVTFNGITEKIETWTLKVQYTIIYPDGSESDPIFYTNSFAVTTKQNDALSVTDANKVTLEPDTTDWMSSYGETCASDYYVTALHGKWIINWKNIYINENEELKKAETPVLSITDNSYEYLQKAADGVTKPVFENSVHSWAKIWIKDYGYYKDNGDGTWSIVTEENGSTLQTLTTRAPMTLDGANMSNDQIQDLWFKWYGNKVNPTINNLAPVPYGTAYDQTSPYQQIWLVESATGRGAFEADFTTYGSSLKLSVTGDASNKNGEAYDTGVNEEDVGTISPYVVLYNSYGLEAKLKDALKVNAENYDTTAAEWEEFQEAIAFAQDQLFGEWVAANFANNHKTTEAYPYTDEDGNAATLATGSSTFQFAGIKLDETMADLEKCKVDDAEGSADAGEFNERDYSPSDAEHPLNGIYNELMAMDAKGYKNHEYVLYRWFKFSDLRESIRYVINAATRPEDAQNTLVGVPLDNEGIDGVVNAVSDAEIKEVIAGMVAAPTQEAIDAANDAINAWLALPLNYSLDALNTKVGDMKTTEARLISKYDSNEEYYLDKALSDYGNVAADGWSAGSYANYVAKRAEAQAVATKADSNTATQYEIHSARYEFLVAYNALVRAADEVDMSALKETNALSEDILAKLGTDEEYALKDEYVAQFDSYEEAKKAAYEELVMRAGYSVTYDEAEYIVGGEYTAEFALKNEGMYTAVKKQNWVNEINTNLANVNAYFVTEAAIPTLAVKDGFDSVIIDTYADAFFGFESGITGVIYGIETLGYATGFETFYALADVLTTTEGDEYLQITASDDIEGYESTGSLIEVIDADGNVLETYYFVYFGDMNGDGYIDNGDATAAETYALDGAIDSVYAMLAGDANADTYTDNGDATAIATAVLNDADYPVQEDIAALYWETILPEYEMM